jgi:hypothetical protein
MNLLRSFCPHHYLAAALIAAPFVALPLSAPAQTPGTILQAPEASKLLPDAVYYAGKSATTQLRNSAGVHYSDDHYVLAVLVDTSGYSSAVQEKYQGYLLTEVPLYVIPLNPGAPPLPPGAYGIGFVGNHFVVTDIGTHDLQTTLAIHDDQMQHPLPLQILGPWPRQRDSHILSDTYRLCFGRDCVDLRRAK